MDAAGWTMGAPRTLTTGATFTNVAAVGADRMLLLHMNGALLVR
jgi:hypothetical protein